MDGPDDVERRAWFRREILPLEAELAAYAQRFCRQGRGEVEDLVNETFVRAIAYKGWRAVNRPGGFAKRILKNIALDDVRHNNVVSIEVVADLDALGLADDDADPEATMTARDELRRLQAIVEALPTQMRRVLTLKRLYDMPTLAVAEALGLSVSTVEKHLTRALRLCSERLARELDLPPVTLKPGRPWARTRDRGETR
ncbi:MAG: sigma-70 family RNA polymerase sigma factor [Caulobacteraceae bacterium]|nr:sigma-70 family RNA polymerase sigma factor [Caulobacteraceae bacterium]